MDTDLVTRAQRGDREAFALLATGFADRFLAVARRILRDIDLAEDATQQALLTVWRDLPQLRDPARFDAWSYRILVRACYSVSRRILRDTNLAQDATQQALLDAWRHLPSLRDPDRFEAWTYRLLVNACYAEARRERRHRGNLRLLPRAGDGVSDETSRIATQDQLDLAFRRLSVEHRTVVVLVHYLGLSPTEAAERMGTPPGTARSRLHYALKELRLAIEADLQPMTTRGTA